MQLRSVYHVPVMVSIKDKKDPKIIHLERKIFAVIARTFDGAIVEAAKYGEVLTDTPISGPFVLNANWQF